MHMEMEEECPLCRAGDYLVWSLQSTPGQGQSQGQALSA